MKRGGGVLVTISMECGGILLSLAPDLQRIRTQPLNTKQFLVNFFVLLVWLKSDRDSSVGWSSCFYVQTNSVSRIRNPLNKASNFLKRKFKKKRKWSIPEFFEISVMTCLLRQLSASTASFLFQPAFASAPLPRFLSTVEEGGCNVSLHTRPLKNLNHPVFCL